VGIFSVSKEPLVAKNATRMGHPPTVNIEGFYIDRDDLKKALDVPQAALQD
jgi:hypothetical protein